MKKIIFLLVIIGTFCLSVLGQNNTSIWTADAIKTNDGEQGNYLKSIEQNWAKARQKLKEKGFIKSFRVFSVAPDKSQPWDVMLLTEYANQTAFEKREEIFAEIFKNQPLVLINGKNPREMGKIVNVDSGYSEAISSENFTLNKTNNAEVKVPLENYLQGHATGNGEFHQKAFYPESRLLWVREGKFTQRSSAEYIKGSSGKPAADEANRKRWIEVVDVTGNAAIAKIILDYPTAYFVDYFALLKIDGEWKIVNKSFHVQPRANQTEKVSFTSSVEEKKAVAVPLENYIKAQATGNGEFMRMALHTEAKVMFLTDGKFTQWSAEEFAGRFNGKAAADEDKRKRSFEILDIAGNAAIAKVTLDYPTVKFTDYMTLLKIDGEWKIINKTFYRESRNVGFVASEAEREAVRQASLDYVESVYEVNPAKAERSVHPDLVKRGFFVKQNETAYSPHTMTFAQLVELTKNYNKNGSIPKNAVKEVVVYDVSDQTASAKVTAVWGIDYLHLAKYEGKWKIINILWQSPPKSK